MFDDVPFAALEVVGDLSDRPQIYGKRDASRSVAGDRGGKLFKINFQLGIRVHFFGLLRWFVYALVGVYLALGFMNVTQCVFCCFPLRCPNSGRSGVIARI